PGGFAAEACVKGPGAASSRINGCASSRATLSLAPSADAATFAADLGDGTLMDFDVLITGGDVVDGTGAARRKADVGINGARIAAVGKLEGSKAGTVVDASGLVVSPGFID